MLMYSRITGAERFAGFSGHLVPFGHRRALGA
jgi:hypothetical protein